MTAYSDCAVFDFADRESYSDYGGYLSNLPAAYPTPNDLYKFEDATTSKKLRVKNNKKAGNPDAHARAPRATQKNFRRLAARAMQHLGPSSDLSKLFSCQEYVQIIGLGPDVVPILLRDMETTGRPWFSALSAITRVDLSSQAEPGDLRALVTAWLAWGRENRYLT
jgi:hypothetical protein